LSAANDVITPRAIPAPPLPIPAARPGFAVPRRLAKISAAVAILAIGGYAALANQGYVVTDNAVVSAYQMPLRTPIAGDLTGFTAPVGAVVPSGFVLGRVRSGRIDDGRLLDLRQSFARATALAAAQQRQQASLLVLQAALRRNAGADLQASRQEIRGRLLQVAATLRQREAQRDLARLQLARANRLLADGVASVAARDTQATDLATATAQVAAEQGNLAALAAQAAAAANGVLLDNGGNDAPYSAQRADELAIELARLDREIAETQANEIGLRGEIKAERSRLARLSTAVLRAPGGGTIWKVEAVAGEHLTQGETVADLVDCASPTILAAIPEDEAPYIAVGSPVRLRLAGETWDRAGRVIAIGGQRLRDDGRALAAVPVPRATGRLILRIVFDAAPAAGTSCLVGRSLRVMIPKRGPGWLGRWLG